MRQFKSFLFPMGLTLVGSLLIGCPKAKGPEVEAQVPEETPVAAVETPASTPEGAFVTVGKEWTALSDLLETVHFDYRSSALSESARASLKNNATALKAILKTAPGLRIRVEGHCDERGTLEYNLALGQRRANAVRDYYFSLGLPRASLSSISYGEERPLCTQADEDCWRQNRRGETTVSSPTGAIKVPTVK